MYTLYYIILCALYITLYYVHFILDYIMYTLYCTYCGNSEYQKNHNVCMLQIFYLSVNSYKF